MRARLSRALVLMAIYAATAVPTSAQSPPGSATDPAFAPAPQRKNAEVGGFWELIHKLSGPEFEGGGLTIEKRPFALNCRSSGFCPVSLVPAFRASFAKLEVAQDDPAVADSINLYMLYAQLTPEFPLIGYDQNDFRALLELGGGATVHWFRGRFLQDFAHFSFPVYGQANLSVRAKGRVWVNLRGGSGWRLFTGLDDDDFEGATVRVENGTEFVRFDFVSLAIRVGR